MIDRKPAPKVKAQKPIPSGKRQFLVYADLEVVKAIKVAAIERDTSASALTEIALREWLERNAKH